MSLLLLLGGAQVQAGDDRTFDATWEQAVAGWEAVAVELNATASFSQLSGWSATMVGPGRAEVDFPSRPIERLRPFSQFYGRLTQEPPSWQATVDVNDDDVTLQELGVL